MLPQTQNRQYLLAARPVGVPKPSDWTLHTQSLPTQLQAGEILIQNQYISLDPAMRGWMNVGKSYIRPVEIGEVMRAGGAGVVVASEHEKFNVGDFVTGTFGVQEFFHSLDGKGVIKVNTTLAPLPTYLGALGMTGMTAYFGLLDVGEAKAGDVVVVSGAAGAVGSIVGQMAKLRGCRVVGIAGGTDKCAYLKETLGFDEAIDYKSGNLRTAIRRACPEGINVYFDNVGGETLDICLSMLAMRARVVICGAISQYNATEGIVGPKNYLSLLVNRARMEGFVVFDYAPRYMEAIKEMAPHLQSGALKSDTTIVEGDLTKFYDAFMTLFEGDKIGKMLLKIR
jgi:NADPH-dependent curcumin reductase